MAQSRVEVLSIPSKVNKEHLQTSLEYFLELKGISDPIMQIKYLGGCSNHALCVTTESPDTAIKKWLVRLPGSQSELLIHRQAEKINTSIVAALGIAPAFEKQFLDEGNVLQQQGYKVENYLENAETLTHESFPRLRKKSLQVLKQVHQCGHVFHSHYHILERIKMMCYALQNVGGHEITHLTYDYGKQHVNLKQILAHINEHEKVLASFGKINLAPCHNDLGPFNFMKVEEGEDQHIYIIDWEYSGMNDPMCELAYIANESGVHTRESIKALLFDYYDKDEKISEDILQCNINRILFYLPLIDLKVAVWSLIQVNLCNQSQYIDDLRSGWGPERYKNYLEKITSSEYQELISSLKNKADTLQSVSIFSKKI